MIMLTAGSLIKVEIEIDLIRQIKPLLQNTKIEKKNVLYYSLLSTLTLLKALTVSAHARLFV